MFAGLKNPVTFAAPNTKRDSSLNAFEEKIRDKKFGSYF
jgi:hypothetical protein